MLLSEKLIWLLTVWGNVIMLAKKQHSPLSLNQLDWNDSRLLWR